MIKTERDFHSLFVKVAREHGWFVAQFRAARTKEGEWRTPVAADAKGYPDFTLVRERVLWAELKGERGSLRPDQRIWIEKLRNAGQEVYVWKPRDLDEIRHVLRWLTPRDERLVTA
jgi:VRR-NUC domain